jgi:DNA replication protein DnaC
MRQMPSLDPGISTWKPPQESAPATCLRCQGTGWVLFSGTGMPVARRCACIRLSRTLMLKDRIGIPQRYGHCTLATYFPGTLSQARAALVARRFVERFPSNTHGLLFAGDSGVGKTHLAAAIVREISLRSRGDALFLEFGKMGEPEGFPRERALSASLLVIDDLGSGMPDGPVFSRFRELLEVRLRERKPMILTAAQVRLRVLCAEKSGESDTAPETFLKRLSPAMPFLLLGQIRKFQIRSR